mmetsp:Transcript_139173/g.242201  ORF Transcript_139173/g.242201 Transcript_139173/m.242201 type:complete len:284 (-) Transcript_139173:32-883(-)
MNQAYFFCALGTFVFGFIMLMVGLFGTAKFQEGTCALTAAGNTPPPFVCERRCSWMGLRCEDYARFDSVSIWLQTGTRPTCNGFYSASGGCQSTGSKAAATTATSCLMSSDESCYMDEAGIPSQETELKHVLIWVGGALTLVGLCSAIAAFFTWGYHGQQALNQTRVLNTGQPGYKRAPLRIEPTHAAPEEHDEPAWNPWLACARACRRQPPPDVRPLGYDRPVHAPQTKAPMMGSLNSLMNFGGGGGHSPTHSGRPPPPASARSYGGDPRASMQMASRGGYH